jgi:uncharacterized protein (TIGR03067 family)
MRYSLLVILCASASAVAYAPAPFPNPKKKPTVAVELQRIQGTWTIAERRLSGKPLNLANYSALRIVIKGDRMTYLRAGQVVTDWTITLGPRASPATITMKRVGGRVKGEATLNGIYLIDGASLKVLHNGAGRPAPASFLDQPPGSWLMVLQREKP